MAAASANISQGMKIISGISSGSGNTIDAGQPDFQILLPENPNDLRPADGVGINTEPGPPDFQVLLPDDPAVLRPDNGIGIDINGNRPNPGGVKGIFPLDLRDQILSMEEALPLMPKGTIGITIPNGVVPTVVNGVLELVNEGQTTLAEGSSSFESGPAYSYDISGDNYEGHADFLAQSGSSQGSIIVDEDGRVIGEGSADYELVIFDAAISGSKGGLDYEASTSAVIEAHSEGSFVFDPEAKTLDAEASFGASIHAEIAGSVSYEFGDGIAEVYAEGHASAGAEINGEGSLEVDLKEGSFGLEGSLDAFAGAEAGIEAGLESDLVDVGISGGAYAGIGIHAEGEIGFEDGKFTMEGSFGLALGVGIHFGVDISIDFNEIGEKITGAIDDFKEGVNDAVNYLSDAGAVIIDAAEDFFEDAGEFIEDAIDDVGDYVEDTWQDIKDTAGDVWEDVSDAAEDVWEDVSNTAEEAWDEVKDTAEDIWDWVSGF